MIHEMLDVLDKYGNKTGIQKVRSEVHRSGEWHASVHVWLVSGKQILLQKRSGEKESFPGCYDASAAGHVSAGEECYIAAIRECEEEIGIKFGSGDLKEIGVLPLKIVEKQSLLVSNEFNHIYLARTDNRDDIIYDKSEIQEVLWMNIEDLKKEITSKNPQYCTSLAEMRLIIENL